LADSGVKKTDFSGFPIFNADDEERRLSRGKATPEKAEHEEATERKKTALDSILMI
jgi:hypothetical protein